MTDESTMSVSEILARKELQKLEDSSKEIKKLVSEVATQGTY